MFDKTNLDKRICDIEIGISENTQTFREFIRESEEEFNICYAPTDEMEEDILSEYLDFMDELWTK